MHTCTHMAYINFSKFNYHLLISMQIEINTKTYFYGCLYFLLNIFKIVCDCLRLMCKALWGNNIAHVHIHTYVCVALVVYGINTNSPSAEFKGNNKGIISIKLLLTASGASTMPPWWHNCVYVNTLTSSCTYEHLHKLSKRTSNVKLAPWFSIILYEYMHLHIFLGSAL